ncbi:MAG: ABC transporter permease [Syntrophales bacterium]
MIDSCHDTSAATQAIKKHHSTVIRPKTGWFDIHLAELWNYRDLVFLFVRRDFVSAYKQTILGPLWYLIQPVLTTIVFTVVFGKIARIPTDGIPPFLFYMAGYIAWAYFAECLTMTANTFVANSGIFGKVYFPRLVVPLATVLTNLMKFAVQFCLFLAFYAYFLLTGASIHPTIWIAVLPVLILEMALLGMGFGIVISSLTTRYRDLAFLVAFGVQLWMYATPVVYPLSQIPGKYHLFFMLNPMTAVVETFRAAFLGSGGVNATFMAVSWMITLLVLFVGIVLFSRIEKTFMDTV